MSDHNIVYLTPINKSVLKQNLRDSWSQDCYSHRAWDWFNDVCSDLDEFTETVFAYIDYCEQFVIPKKSISFFFPNDKPWVSISFKTMIIQRNVSVKQGDDSHCRALQKRVKKERKLAKLNYKDKVETLLSTGNSRPAWESAKSMIDIESNKCAFSLAGKMDSKLANDLYNCFHTLAHISARICHRVRYMLTGTSLQRLYLWPRVAHQKH